MNRAPKDRIPPGPGQESVWDYPRPPRVERVPDAVRITTGGRALCESARAMRVLETSHPPVIYVPPQDVAMSMLRLNRRSTFCEYKGHAAYYDLVTGDTVIPSVAWSYPTPTAAFADLAGYLAFYPSTVDCFLAGEPVDAQPGDFYGGWITSRVVGPFKGAAGTMGW